MISVIALLLAVLAPASNAAGTGGGPRAPDSQVTGLSVTPAGARTEFVIRVDGEVTARDFMLADARLVIDLIGASQATAVERELNRGGVLQVRLAQYQPGVVRVVLVLAAQLEYRMATEPGVVRVSLANPAGIFEPWSAEMLPATPTQAVAPAQPRNLLQEQQRRQPPISVSFDAEPVKNVI